MSFKDLFKKKSKEEKINDLEKDLKIERLKAQIRQEKNKGQKKKKALDGWNPDSRHLDNMFGGGMK